MEVKPVNGGNNSTVQLKSSKSVLAKALSTSAAKSL